MNYETKINQLDEMIIQLKDFKKEIKNVHKLSTKARDMNPQSNTQKQMQNANANLNFACMHLDKQHIKVWRQIKESFLETNTEDREYFPSGFHHYK